jgi:hypothetical protein
MEKKKKKPRTDDFLPREQRVKNAMIEAELRMKSILLVESTFFVL